MRARLGADVGPRAQDHIEAQLLARSKKRVMLRLPLHRNSPGCGSWKFQGT